MFKTLKIWNFQAHRVLEIGLDPGITVIKGPSDVGKSAILRAFRWLCLNDFSGGDFITWGKKEAVAALELDGTDGKPCKIARRKGVENIYRLNGKTFRAFGAKVPDPVAKVLALSEINFQAQLDPHFWFGESAPEVSRQLNRVIDLSVIDSSASAMSGFARTARERVAVSEERLREKEQALEAAQAARKRIDAFNTLTKKRRIYDETKTNCDKLAEIVQDLDSTQIDIAERKADLIKGIYARGVILQGMRQRIDALTEMCDGIDSARSKIRDLPKFEPIQKAMEKLSEIRRRAAGLNDIVSKLDSAEEALHESQKNFDAIHAKASKFGCPVCGARK